MVLFGRAQARFVVLFVKAGRGDLFVSFWIQCVRERIGRGRAIGVLIVGETSWDSVVQAQALPFGETNAGGQLVVDIIAIDSLQCTAHAF